MEETATLSLLDFFDLKNCSFPALFSECGFPWEPLAKLRSFLDSASLGKIDCSVPATATLGNPHLISIGEGTRIEPYAYIEGPCIIGKNCEVRHGAYIRPYCLMDDGSVAGHGTELKHSLLLKGAKAPHFNYIGDSILGNGANLGAGAVCANLRLDNNEVIVHFFNKKYRTGLKKLGAIIGDGAQIGCHTVLNPGTLVFPNAISLPCLTLKGVQR